MSYPQVTEVGSELARPDDGTDPTWDFSIANSTWALKQYKDPIWQQELNPHQSGSHRRPAEARLSTPIPGVIFNYTQLAEDAVDEALTGLKSALAGKNLWTGICSRCWKTKQWKSSAEAVANSRLYGADRGAGIGPAHGAD